jgi:hypothetical protein
VALIQCCCPKPPAVEATQRKARGPLHCLVARTPARTTRPPLGRGRGRPRSPARRALCGLVHARRRLRIPTRTRWGGLAGAKPPALRLANTQRVPAFSGSPAPHATIVRRLLAGLWRACLQPERDAPSWRSGRLADNRNFSNADELRIDIDGLAYPFQAFEAYYKEKAQSAWATAKMIPAALWQFYYLPLIAIVMSGLQNVHQCRQQKKKKSEKCRQVVTSSFRNPESPLIFFAPPNL